MNAQELYELVKPLEGTEVWPQYLHWENNEDWWIYTTKSSACCAEAFTVTDLFIASLVRWLQ